jgi:hypothetical protein
MQRFLDVDPRTLHLPHTRAASLGLQASIIT